jgi:ribosome-binding factor A
MHDPGLQGLTLTVTEVRMSPDLRHASVFVTPLGGGDTAQILAALARARPFLRRQVAGTVRLKFAPDLVFLADETFENARRIDTLLRDPRVSRDLSDGADEAVGVPGEPDDGI